MIHFTLQQRVLLLVGVVSLSPVMSLAVVLRLPDEEAVAAKVDQVTRSDPKEFLDIPWVNSLEKALEVSQVEHRPVFLFTHDGNMNTGRC